MRVTVSLEFFRDETLYVLRYGEPEKICVNTLKFRCSTLIDGDSSQCDTPMLSVN